VNLIEWNFVLFEYFIISATFDPITETHNDTPILSKHHLLKPNLMTKPMCWLHRNSNHEHHGHTKHNGQHSRVKRDN